LNLIAPFAVEIGLCAVFPDAMIVAPVFAAYPVFATECTAIPFAAGIVR
jgi:hypothetical protein